MIRILPIPFRDIRRCQQYFKDMSKRGYHLKKVWPPFAVFKKGEPKECEYLIRPLTYIEPSKFYGFKRYFASLRIGPLPSGERIQEFLRAGYRLVDTHLNIYVFAGERQCIKREVPADEDEKSRQYYLLGGDEMLKIQGVILFFYSFIMMATMSYEGVVYLLILEPRFICLYILWLWLIISVITKGINIIKNKREFDLPIEKIQTWQSKRKKCRRRNIIMGILLLASIGITWGTCSYGDYQYFRYTQEELPNYVLRLADVENIEESEKIIYGTERYDANCYRENEILLSELNYYIKESYYIEGRTNAEGETYEAEIEIKYRRLAADGIAEVFFKGLLKECKHLDLSDENIMKSRVFDKVYGADDGRWKYVFVIRDEETLFIQYRGERTLDEILLAAEKFYGE